MGESGMDDSLYAEKGMDETAPKESVDEESAAKPTALIPTSAFGGNVTVGDTVTMKVLKLHGEEVEVELSSDGETESPAEELSANEELDTMATGKEI